MEKLSRTAHRLLRSLEPHAKTDVVYLASGGFWLVLGQAGAALTAFAFSLVVARYLPPDTYGSYRYVSSLVAMIGAVSLTGLGTTIVRAVAQGHEASLPAGFKKNVRWSALMILCFMGVAGYYGFQGASELALSILVAGAATTIVNAASLYNAYWNGKQDFYRSTLYWSIANTLSTTAAVLAILYTSNLLMVVSAFFIGSACIHLLLYYVTRRQLSIPPTPQASTDQDSVHLSFLNFLNTVATHVDKIIVFQMLGAAQLAVYTFALAIPDQLRAVLKSGARLALPRFAERPFSHIQASLGERLLRFSGLIVCMAIAYVFAAPYVFHWLFPAYISSVPYSQLFALTLFTTLGTIPLAALQAHAKTRALYTHALISNAVQITSSIVLIYHFGLWGAAAAVVINRFANLIVPLYLFRHA